MSCLESGVLEGYILLNGFLEELDGEERLMFDVSTSDDGSC